MRSKLQPLYKQKCTFQGTFTKFGSYHTEDGTKKYTMLVQNIQLTNKRPCVDHLWVEKPDDVDSLNLQRGQRIQFTGLVDKYCRVQLDGNYNNDYEIRNIKDICKLS